MEHRTQSKRNNDLRCRVFRRLREAFQLQLLPDGEKVVQAVLLHLHLPVVDEVHHRYQICSLRKGFLENRLTRGMCSERSLNIWVLFSRKKYSKLQIKISPLTIGMQRRQNLVAPSVLSEAMVAGGHLLRDLGKMYSTPTRLPEKNWDLIKCKNMFHPGKHFWNNIIGMTPCGLLFVDHPRRQEWHQRTPLFFEPEVNFKKLSVSLEKI